MIELAKIPKEYHHRVQLNRDFRSDLQWWRVFLPGWNGVSFMSRRNLDKANTTIYSDASGSWGFGAWCQPRLQWFQGAWPLAWQSTNITANELLSIVLAAVIWGPQWRGQAVHFRCDNAAIVHTIASSRNTEPLVMQLLRGLHLFAMEYGFQFTASHIAGADNGPADTLSRNQASLFHSQVPQAPADTEDIPEDMHQLFLAEAPPDWLSETWRWQLIFILKKASLNQP